MTTSASTATHYFVVQVWDDDRSHWSFDAAVADLRRRAEHVARLGRRDLWAGDIYAVDALTGRTLTGGDFGRAVAKIDADGRVVVTVPSGLDSAEAPPTWTEI